MKIDALATSVNYSIFFT